MPGVIEMLQSILGAAPQGGSGQPPRLPTDTRPPASQRPRAPLVDRSTFLDDAPQDVYRPAMQMQAQPQQQPNAVQNMPPSPQVSQSKGNFGQDIGDFINTIGIGLMLSDPQFRGVGQMMLGQQQERKKEAKEQARQNQTVSWLQKRGVGSDVATYLAGDPDALRAWVKEDIAGNKPDWQITDMYDDDGRKIKAMFDKTSGKWKQIGGAADPEKNTLINAGGGAIYNPKEKTWITAPNQGQSEQPSRVREYEFARSQGFPGTFSDWLASQKGGMSLQVDPETGAVTFQQGGNIKPMTEGQSKDTVYATRAAGALPLIDKFGNSLTSLGETVGGQAPVVGNYLRTPEYQQAEQAGKEFLQAILRKDTGAAITKEETEEYGSVYLPRPGDSPQVLAQKKAARQRALEALKAGMTPQSIMAMENALKRGDQPSRSQTSNPTNDPLGIR